MTARTPTQRVTGPGYYLGRPTALWLAALAPRSTTSLLFPGIRPGKEASITQAGLCRASAVLITPELGKPRSQVGYSA
jgi:hypothetical protein